MTLDIRRATVDDRPAITALLRRSLAVGDDPRYDRFLEWKHHENPFGASFEWVALDGSTIVGYRSFLRWQFVAGDAVWPAVRAVDTATHTDHRNRGVFTAMTMHAIDELRDDGVAWIFNTPNRLSEPGYLKMGWSVLGTVPVSLSVRNPLALRHLRRTRVPSELWSEPVDGFESVTEFLARVPETLGEARREGVRWTTNRTPDFLRWRYGLDDLHYRVLPAGRGGIVFRVRRRGSIREAVVVDHLANEAGAGAPHVARRDVHRILRATKADIAVVAGALRTPRALSIRGPRLTWRPVTDERIPTIDQLALRGGDVELF